VAPHSVHQHDGDTINPILTILTKQIGQPQRVDRARGT